MSRTFILIGYLIAVSVPSPAQAQPGANDPLRPAPAEVCITIDEAHDTLPPQDRAAALLLVARQFELAGKRVVSGDCPVAYTVSHVKLGNTIAVTLSGPTGRQDGTALGLDDLPALYSQMVRSIVTGRPMSGFAVTDRTNVTRSQASAPRVQSDSFGYARLGYGSISGDRTYSAPAMGLGYRAELDRLAFDVSFVNSLVRAPNASYASTTSDASGGTTLTFLRLEALYFLKPAANASPYVGGGLSWGATYFSENGTYSRAFWHGSGLQGELTVGYELPRASTLRMFVQADAVLPFYRVTSETVTYSRVVPTGTLTTQRRYAPSFSVSVGIGWQRDRHRRP